MQFPFRLIAIILVASTLVHGSETFTIEGVVVGKAFDATGPKSWLEGAWGRLASADNQDTQGAGRVEAAITWEPSLWFKAYIHGLGRLEPDDYEGDEAGIAEAYIEASAFLGDASRFKFRLGLFFPPTSMENTGSMWTSPYTLSFSAINTWIGEEMRMLGLDISYAHEFAPSKDLFWGLTAFGGNDTLGALLAWRGWAMGDRLSVPGEVLPIPSHSSLSDGAVFGAQRDSGTKPFGSDLDDNPGYAARFGVDIEGRWVFQGNWVDNRADRQLYGGDYAWETDFISLGSELELIGGFTFIGEYMKGKTGMGIASPGNGHVQLDFQSYYGLLTWFYEGWRVTGRLDDFQTEDRDFEVAGFNADLNDEDGDGLTLAVIWEFLDHWRIGLEWLELDVHRAAITPGGRRYFDGGEAWTLEIRYAF